jgi:hypothetical protein
MSTQKSVQATDAKTAYVRTAREDEALNKIREKQAEQAPTLKAAKDGILPGVVPDHPDEITGIILLMEALGTTDLEFARGLVGQVTAASEKGGKVDADGVNFILSVIKNKKPQDHLEGMLAAQMAGVHMASMKALRDLADAEYVPQKESAERTANRLMRTYVAQMEARKRYRSGGEQTMTVQHVTVAEGGQAIVGNVTQDQRHPGPAPAPLAIADAKMIPMPVIEARDAATITAGRGQKV